MQGIIAAVAASLLGAACLAMFRSISKSLKDVHGKVDANNTATRYLLKERILQMCTACQGRGSITPEEAETVQEMAEQYHTLGGNSFITAQVEHTLALPIARA